MKIPIVEMLKRGTTPMPRINELIQEAEQALEVQDRQLPPEPRFRPPKDSLIPPGHSTGTPSPIRSVQGREPGPRGTI